MSEAPPSTPPEGIAAPPRSNRLAVKLSILPVLGLLGFVLLYGAGGVGRDTSQRIHSLRNAAACTECHPEGDAKSLNEKEPGLCLRCHPDLMNHGVTHPLFMKVETCTDPALWLQDGEMTCSTCHDPHGKTPHPGLMRRTGNARCLPCHPDKGGHH